jgi:hypothetical protein
MFLKNYFGRNNELFLNFSFHQTKFASQRPEALGAALNEQILKDYNGQTYWFSFNIHSFTKDSFFPKWLNLAFGYGGEGMLYGNDTEAIENSFFAKSVPSILLEF